MTPLPDDPIALAQRLADLDEAGAVGPSDGTVANLKAELETIAGDLRRPADPSAFDHEPRCGALTAMVQAIGRDPGTSAAATVDLPGGAAAAEQAEQSLGTLGVYELLTKLGEGGMGAVYKARHTKLDKIVAIKVLPAERMKDTGAVARFEREMRAVGRLEHPNIVRAMDANEEGGLHYLVMEYVQGIDLSQLSARCGPLPMADACELIRQAAIGFDEAYDNGMVHRDIKPSNLMLCVVGKKKPPVVKILDMGLALLAEAHSVGGQGLTSTGQVMGTLDYMAPEQGGDSKSVDIRADIYALGASLYKLLCGEVIYAGDQYQTPVQKLMALAMKPAPPIEERCPGVPKPLSIVLGRMLDKDPAARIATPDEVARALAPFCEGATLAALLHRAGIDVARGVARGVTRGVTPGFAFGFAPGSEETASAMTPSTAAPLHDTLRFPTPTPTVAAKPQPSGGGTWRPRTMLLLGGGLLGFGGLAALAAVMVFYVQTPRGTLRVEVDDPSIEVQIKGTDIVLTNADKKVVRLSPGEHAITVKRGDFQFDTSNFVLTKGETTTVKVDLLPGTVQVTSGGQVIGKAARVDMTDGLIAYWPFDGDLRSADTSGSLVGTARGKNPKFIVTPFGQGISLDGSSWIEVADRAPFDVGDGEFTVAAWIRPRAMVQSGIVCLGGYNYRHGWLVDMPYDSGIFRIETSNQGNAPNGTVQSQPGALQPNIWQHVAAVVRRGAHPTRLFINGKQVAEGMIKDADLDNPQAKLQIGRIEGGQLFHGDIDEVRIYRGALSDAEIAKLAEPPRELIGTEAERDGGAP